MKLSNEYIGILIIEQIVWEENEWMVEVEVHVLHVYGRETWWWSYDTCFSFTKTISFISIYLIISYILTYIHNTMPSPTFYNK